MIKRPNNWNEVREFSDSQKLPLDAYVCKIRRAAVQNNGYGDQLCLLLDIHEGEFAGFYDNDFKNNTNQDKKWKGVLRVWLPKDDGSEKDEWTKSAFKGMVTAFEKSNHGYQWNWDEASLVGKLIGVLFRNEEWEYNNKTGWTVRPFKTISVDRVREGDFTLPADKPLKNKSTSGGSDIDDLAKFGNVKFEEMDDDGELPF